MERRKGAQSLYTNINPLNLDHNRIRIESNYTTRSGGGGKILADVTDVASIKSSSKGGMRIGGSKKREIMGKK